jgi:hypothetical protein
VKTNEHPQFVITRDKPFLLALLEMAQADILHMKRLKSTYIKPVESVFKMIVTVLQGEELGGKF